MTGAESKSWLLNWPSHLGTPQFFLTKKKSWVVLKTPTWRCLGGTYQMFSSVGEEIGNRRFLGGFGIKTDFKGSEHNFILLFMKNCDRWTTLCCLDLPCVFSYYPDTVLSNSLKKHFFESLQCVRHCPRQWVYIGESNRFISFSAHKVPVRKIVHPITNLW